MAAKATASHHHPWRDFTAVRPALSTRRRTQHQACCACVGRCAVTIQRVCKKHRHRVASAQKPLLATLCAAHAHKCAEVAGRRFKFDHYEVPLFHINKLLMCSLAITHEHLCNHSCQLLCLALCSRFGTSWLVAPPVYCLLQLSQLPHTGSYGILHEGERVIL